MGLKERRQRHKDEFKAEILEAALTLFVQEGYNEFSMRKLASRIEYSTCATMVTSCSSRSGRWRSIPGT